MKRRPEHLRRTVQLNAEVTREEKAAFDAKAREVNLTRSSYLRLLIRAAVGMDPPEGGQHRCWSRDKEVA